MLLSFTLIAISFGVAESVVFTCPTNPIKFVTPNVGIIGVDPTGETKVPAGTNCLINFQIPDGYSLRVVTFAEGDIESDIFEMENAFGEKYKNDYRWFIKKATLKIASPNGTMSFFVRYQYKSIHKSPTNLVPRGTPFPTQIQTETVYKLTQQRLAISIGRERTSGSFSKDIYFYDGDDLRNATLLGRLADLMKNKDRHYFDGTTLQIVSLHLHVRLQDVIVVNEASAVENLTSYSIVIPESTISKTILSGSACTFISSEFYGFNVKNMTISNEHGRAQIQGQSPTQKLPKIIEYTNDVDLNARFPQLIPTETFTVYAIDGNVTLIVEPARELNSSITGRRKGVIVSSNLWNSRSIGRRDYTYLESAKELYNFTIGFEKTAFNNSETFVSVSIGSFNGSHTRVMQSFTDAQKPTDSISGIGNFLAVEIGNSVNTTDIRMTYTAEGASKLI